MSGINAERLLGESSIVLFHSTYPLNSLLSGPLFQRTNLVFRCSLNPTGLESQSDPKVSGSSPLDAIP